MIVTRLESFLGWNKFKNDVILFKNKSTSNQKLAIYFGGDIQDYHEKMKSHEENKRYQEWNLEATGRLLMQKFTNHIVMVIKASRMANQSYACYDHFVKVNKIGAPSFGSDLNSLNHLKCLIENSLTHDQELIKPSSLSLIGFSKGSVVLNQILYSLKSLENSNDDNELKAFASKIDNMYWLDGGHPGHHQTWITDVNILATLKYWKISVHIHVTPFQVNNSSKPWNGKEEKAFHSILTRLEVNCYRRLYYQNQAPSLNRHFQILRDFELDNYQD